MHRPANHGLPRLFTPEEQGQYDGVASLHGLVVLAPSQNASVIELLTIFSVLIIETRLAVVEC